MQRAGCPRRASTCWASSLLTIRKLAPVVSAGCASRLRLVGAGPELWPCSRVQRQPAPHGRISASAAAALLLPQRPRYLPVLVVSLSLSLSLSYFKNAEGRLPQEEGLHLLGLFLTCHSKTSFGCFSSNGGVHAMLALAAVLPVRVS